MMGILKRFGWAGFVVILVAAGVARGDDADPKERIADLKGQIEALQKQVEAIEKEAASKAEEGGAPVAGGVVGGAEVAVDWAGEHGGADCGAGGEAGRPEYVSTWRRRRAGC